MSLISVTPKLDAFTKFCSEQDPAIEIDHTNGWRKCAIGEFSKTFPECDGHMHPFHTAHGIGNELRDVVSYEQSEEFLNTLGNGDEHPEIATYGGMTEWLNQIRHVAHEAAQ